MSKKKPIRIYIYSQGDEEEFNELKEIEFPNTNAVINSYNNYLYWRNKEDIELDFTLITNNILNHFRNAGYI